MSLRPVTLIVCGEALRGDDALADAVVRALPATTRRIAAPRSVGGLMPEDLLGAVGPVIVVDAVHGLEPGAIVDLPLGELPELFASGVTPGSSHALPLPMILAIVERLAGGLPEGRFIGIAGADFTLGADLSPEVRAAIEPCAARLNHWVRALAHGRRAPQCA